MHTINATWKDGRILPSEPVNWPEGSELLVQPIDPPSEKLGLPEEDWRDDPESIATWIKWVDTIEPLELSETERTKMERFRTAQRQFNIDAVRERMGLGEAS